MRALLTAPGLVLMALAAPAAATPPTAAPAAAAASGAGPALAPGSRDLEARDRFQSGRYADALAIYVQLYAETHHPTYLRNIGRCRQMMREPDPAIESFRGYLREARDLDPSERAEINGYIAEMQRLKLSSPAPATPPAFTTGGAPAMSTSRAGDAPPITRRWWFWTGIGALAVAGVIAAVAAGGATNRLPCPPGGVCPP
jgi:hypothetical protein